MTHIPIEGKPMFLRAIFLALIADWLWTASAGHAQQSPAAASSTPRAAVTPTLLPSTTYATVTLRPTELMQQPALRSLYDAVVKTYALEAQREQQEFLRNSRGATRIFHFPQNDQYRLLDLETLTLQMSTRRSPLGEPLFPSESRVYRFHKPAKCAEMVEFAKRGYTPTSAPGFPSELLVHGSARSFGSQKPLVPREVPEPQIEDYIPIPPGKPLTPKQLEAQRFRVESDRDRQPIPETERWKYMAAIWPADERTLLYSMNGETVLQMLDAKNSPFWAGDYAKVAGYPLSAAIDLKQVRENAKQGIHVAYFKGLNPELQQALQTVIEQAELALIAADATDGLKLFARVQTADTNAAKQTAAAIEKLRANAGRLASPWLAEVNRMAPGCATPFVEQLQTAVADLTITPNGNVIALQLRIPADKTAEAAKKSLAALERAEKNLPQIQVWGRALQQYLEKYLVFPNSPLSKGGHAVSWRVRMLPLIGENNLFKQYNQDEPWDSETNQKVLAQMPAFFRAPGADPKSTMTSYVLPVHPRAICPAVPMKGALWKDGVSDGTSNTIAILETETQIPWTKPEDLVIDDKQPLPALGFKDQPMVRVIMASGDIRAIHKNVTLEQLIPWLTPQGDEVLRPLDVE